MIRKILDWVDHRTGLETAAKAFLYEEIPGSSGWQQVFGSIAMFLFLIQVFTGILLAFNYAPTPGEAYNSLKYIVTELTAGRLIRGLHHWGASMMIVVVALHMIQVFLYGAYKKPREATWIVGVVLLLLVLAYGLTGYLLPWDNRAYWGTVVATQIGANIPLMGQYVSRLLGGEGAIGVVTFARFYALHVLLLPPITMLLIGVHVYLVRKHGVAPNPGDVLPKKSFYPGQVFKDTVGIFIAFAILFTLAVAVRVPLERVADPTDTSYIPRPEWYFLFLFQTLKFFEGPLEVVGSVVLPGLAVTALFLLPFIDRGQVMKLTQRTVAAGVVLLAVLGWTGLTVAAYVTTPKQPVTQTFDENEGPQDWQKLPAPQIAGIGYYRQGNCESCHAMNGKAGKGGPDLSAGSKKDTAWMVEHFKHSPQAQLTSSQASSLAAFLGKLTAQDAVTLQTAPQHVVEGAMVYQSNKCGACHQVNGAGMKMGPPLNGVGNHRTREWLEQHFVDPQKMSPGSTMPPYKLGSKDMDRLIEFLMAMPA